MPKRAAREEEALEEDDDAGVVVCRYFCVDPPEPIGCVNSLGKGQGLVADSSGFHLDVAGRYSLDQHRKFGCHSQKRP